MICYLYSKPIFLLFSSDVPSLLYYAQIPATVIALLLGFYIFWNGREFLLNRLLFLIAILFSLWTLATLIVWAGNNGGLFAFIWPFYDLILSSLVIFCVYFIYVFLMKEDVSSRLKIIFLALLAPVLFLTTTNLNISGFNITNCDAFDFEWLPFKLYCIFLGILAMVWIFVLLVRSYRIASPAFKKQIALIGTGMELFLFLFFIWTNLVYYLTDIGVFTDSRLELYGMLGMVIFMIYISILTVRFGLFNVKLLATQALVFGLVVLIGSQFFFIKTKINFVLNGITFAGSLIFGILLIRSVNKEIKQKQQLEGLLQQRESLVHLITHKVKGSFTHSKYIFAGLLEGMYGEINDGVKKIAKFGLDSDDVGIHTVDLVLNASNLQKGTIKYDLKPFDFRKLVTEALSGKENGIKEKGLELKKEIDENENFTVNGDAFWLKEVVNNLLENSLKYTPKGSMTVGLEKKDGKVIFYVKDTGVGISDEDKKNLFTEGGRGKESVKINVDSTGYGLYSVKLIMDGHHGKVWAVSDGPGKGSEFFVELDAG